MKKTIREVIVTYNKSALLYDLMNQIYFFGMDRRFRALLAERLNLKPGDIALDLCCGTGLDFPFLLEKIEIQGMLLGVDLSSEMLQQAKKKIGSGEVNLVRSDAAHMPFRDETFDAIFVSFCLKITPSYERVIEEDFRVLKPAGRLGVLANNKPSGPLWLPGIILTTILCATAKIDFGINLKEQLSKEFIIIEDRKMYGGLVQFLVGRAKLVEELGENALTEIQTRLKEKRTQK